MIDKNVIDKFIFNTIRRSDMTTNNKLTRLRFNKLTDQDVWRTKPLFTDSGYRYAEIQKLTDTYLWTINSYPEDVLLVTGQDKDFHTLKVHIKNELKKLGCVFLDEVRMKNDKVSNEG